jgi:hypothetical protein
MFELLPHQAEVVGRLKTGSILVGGVGSGKSIAALAYYFNHICLPDSRGFPTKHVALYVITTAMKRDTLDWIKEAANFSISNDQASSILQVDFVVDSWNRIKKYVNVKDSFFIFDEQKVVGSGAWVRSFIKISKHNKWILLTATPGDTWIDYIPVFVANGFYENRTDFIREHVVYNTFVKFPKVDRYIGLDKLIRNRDQISIHMDYVPHTTRRNFKIILPYDETKSDIVRKRKWNVFTDKPVKGITEAVYLLRRVSNSDESRQAQLLKLIKEHPKLIVFYSFDYELDILKKVCAHADVVFGERNGHKHDPQPSGNRWVYLVNYMSGAEGWNCIDSDTIVFYSQQYSFKILEQASGRIDRQNTKFRTLNYFHFMSESWIDNEIRHSLDRKQDFNGLSKKVLEYLGYPDIPVASKTYGIIEGDP